MLSNRLDDSYVLLSRGADGNKGKPSALGSSSSSDSDSDSDSASIFIARVDNCSSWVATACVSCTAAIFSTTAFVLAAERVSTAARGWTRPALLTDFWTRLLESRTRSSFVSREFNQRASSMAITAMSVPVEAHWSIGLVERYHHTLRRCYKIITEELKDSVTSKDVRLQMVIKTVNDSAGLNGLIPTLLVFGIFPRMCNLDAPSPDITKRASATKSAVDEVIRVRAKREVNESIGQRNGPSTTLVNNLTMGSKVLVIREGIAGGSGRWTGLFELLSFERETWIVRLSNGPTNLRSTVVKPYYIDDSDAIIATRKRREQAWLARLVICTTVISYLDSSLVNSTNEIEKEEVAAFKAYLRQAIANFADADSPPSPPQVPIHPRPKKGSGKGIDKNLAKKTTVATPRIILSQAVNRETNKEADPLKIPQASDKIWAVVARKGHKKARIVNVGPNYRIVVPTVNNNQTQVVAGNKSAPKPFNKKNSSTPVSDTRSFVCLPQEHEWRKLSLAGIRGVLVKKLSISPALIGKIKPVHSGFAFSPCSTEARDKILNAGNGLFLSGAKLEAATNWVSVLIPTVPAFIRKKQGEV
ncbi:hypothetical protein EV44_g3759 [Erysiphe necator]|uniref:Integrase catalytic domain-containing protein n=1 Tax=Uncinula necator TaxID=52586 RepID=A0A0B1P5A7_UNCNE|nr:hypothetical protein EV44_g3759 [Erysiphe necator]